MKYFRNYLLFVMFIGLTALNSQTLLAGECTNSSQQSKVLGSPKFDLANKNTRSSGMQWLMCQMFCEIGLPPEECNCDAIPTCEDLCAIGLAPKECGDMGRCPPVCTGPNCEECDDPCAPPPGVQCANVCNRCESPHSPEHPCPLHEDDIDACNPPEGVTCNVPCNMCSILCTEGLGGSLCDCHIQPPA